MPSKGYSVLGAMISLPIFFSMSCGSSSHSGAATSTPPTPQVVAIAASAGSAQSAASGKAFIAPLSVAVTVGGLTTSGEKVTFTAPASGASGTFANGTASDVEVTNNLGVATSSVFTANSLPGAYQITATVKDASAPAIFDLTNIAITPYSFFMSGQDASGGYYALAGAVLLDASGNVLGGEQDYNDGGFGDASPEPKGDRITGGALTFPPGAPAGQALLALTTNNTSLGLNADGTEVFGVQFVNSGHALMTQFDGFATSSGSMDLQTLPSAPKGAYAFAVSGFDSASTPVAYGGVFAVSGTAASGTIDINDSYNLGETAGTAITLTFSAPDSYGRGNLKGLKIGGTAVTLNYYVVGPEAIRLIDVDTTDAALGSAFGQGAGSFNNPSLGQSVVAVSGNVLDQFAALAQFTTSNTTSSPASFSGVGDDSEPLNGIITSKTQKIAGTYSIGANGYGSMAFNPISGNYPGLGDVTTLGIYMTDPALNLNDPNNPVGGGGALTVELDSGLSVGVALPGAIGVIVPQTDADTATADFAGNYAAAWQNFDDNGCGCEFDMLAQGTMAAGGDLSLTGMVSDPFSSLGVPDAASSSNTLAGTPTPDANNPGRYTMTTNKTSLSTVIDGAPGPNFDMILYQASGGQLFWMDYDASLTTVSLGPIEQQGTLPVFSAATHPIVGSARRLQSRMPKKR